MAGPPLENNAGHIDYSTIICFAQRIRRTVSEMDSAGARLTAVRVCGSAGQSGRAPDTYAGFLLRTLLPLPHEPPARGRPAPQ
jgi:hypothetical protein